MPAENTYKHGVYYHELPTTIIPAITTSTPAVIFGTAPLFNAATPTQANEVVLISSYSEFVSNFGWSDDFDKYTLCEAAKVFFSLYNVAPIVCVNVLDPATHSTQTTKTISGVSNAVTISEPILLDTLQVTTGSGSSAATLSADDYTATYDGEDLIFTVVNDEDVVSDSVMLSYKKVNADAVTNNDIIGGVNATTGKKTGLELIEEVYPVTGLIPGTILAPKYSAQSAVAAAMKAKTRGINGCFNTICAVDLDTSTVIKYNDCFSAKTQNNLSDENTIVCWPKVSLGGEQYHLSAQVAALMCQVDNDNDDVPYISPSNHNLQCDASCLANGTAIKLSKLEANYLNGAGVVTALNFAGGWKCWGNRTGRYPASSDPKDTFICVRRMMSYIGNSLITTYFSKVDNPLNRRLIESVVDSLRIWLNGLAARGVILGGEVTFDALFNPTTSLLDGNITFHVSIGFIVPAKEIHFDIEFEPSYMNALFE